jgi:hypothetical protein
MENIVSSARSETSTTKFEALKELVQCHHDINQTSTGLANTQSTSALKRDPQMLHDLNGRRCCSKRPHALDQLCFEEGLDHA